MKKVTVGVICPYNAQVLAIQEKLRKMKFGSLLVKINSVDGFQGGEEDIIILSTVRSNADGVTLWWQLVTARTHTIRDRSPGTGVTVRPAH
jgi:hypothetical protein